VTRPPTRQDVEALQALETHHGYRLILGEVEEMIALAGGRLDAVPAENVAEVARLQERRKVLREVLALRERRVNEWTERIGRTPEGAK
jgi:hypothetical protein